MTRLIFGAAVAILLLLLYLYAIALSIRTAYCFSNPSQCNCQDFPTCSKPPDSDFYKKYNRELNEPLLYALTLVGGLVSALVVSVLAITPPSKPIGWRIVKNLGDPSQKIVTIVATMYVAVWFIAGIALVIAWFKYDAIVPAVASGAKSWLGLAVAAAYSYLGLEPK